MAGGRRFDVAAQRSTLTGAEIRQRLQAAGISVEAFAEVFGIPQPALRRMTEDGWAGGIPMLVELALFYFERNGDKLRDRPRPTDSPRNRFGYRLDVYLTGEEIAARLKGILWSVPDFARLTGLTDRSIRHIIKGRMDSRLTVLLGFALELVERYPLEMQALPRVLTAERQSRARSEALFHMRRRDDLTTSRRLWHCQ